jgi:tripartite-type tricarboxylate transporter receptor subunit TctC
MHDAAQPARPRESGDPGQQPPNRARQFLDSRFRGNERLWLTLCLIASFAFVPPARAQSVEDFYRGKSISLIIGFSVGGGYDLYARHLARHMSKHIPGKPAIVPQNMTGAGSLRAANFIYSAAPKDGTAIGTVTRSTGINPLLESGATFDGTKFAWIGSVTNEISTCITWRNSAVKTLGDFLEKPLTLGGQGPSSDPDMFANIYRNVFGAKIKLVSGYPGTNEITLAMERGEVDGICGLSWGTIKTRHAQWLKEKKINLIVQASFKKDPELRDIPLIMDLVKTQEQRQILSPFLAAQEMARPFIAPPGIPEDRKAALRTAFDDTMKDPEYLADAQRLKIEVNPVSGQEIDRMLAELYATPKEIFHKASQAITK